MGKTFELDMDMNDGLPNTQPIPKNNGEETIIAQKGNVTSVTLPTSLGQAGPAPAPEPSRPDWLPPKFKSPADLAAAYEALEAKLGAAKSAGGAAPSGTNGLADALAGKPAAPAGGTQPAANPLEGALTEYTTTGKLGEETKAALKKAGIPDALVDTALKNAAFASQAATDMVMGKFGGADGYKEAVSKANSVLNPSEIASYNEIMGSGDYSKMKLAVDWLHGRIGGNSVPVDPAGGTVDAFDGGGFRSDAELLHAQMDKRYGVDPRYTAEVTRKAAAMLQRAARR